jgi:hypothetical protein
MGLRVIECYITDRTSKKTKLPNDLKQQNYICISKKKAERREYTRSQKSFHVNPEVTD